ncbi:LysR family transcriptional regulator [Clostridium estertheticum]|uniref:LysR family transcriptional regulator n=1 Tax=Clostridium estertheticum TaxID=238834 RepID=UPI0013E945E5|nr:LysR family transcriptional regulator [Clostridium estertheticum]MBZ9685247.1 LysR family transcriptional regulator [Clostridium estertheticum]
MTLRHFRIFIAVCENNSITATGKKLHITQPSVSIAIRELEENYGVKLFDRVSRRLYITETGKQLLEYATHIVSLTDEVEVGIKDWDSFGTLRVGSSIAIGFGILPSYVKAFEQQIPSVKVNVAVNDTKTIEEYILRNTVDIALIEGKVQSPNIEQIKFMDDELVLVCGKKHPFSRYDEIELNMLDGQDFILRERGSDDREFFESFLAAHELEINTRWESISILIIFEAVKAGLGLTILPEVIVKAGVSLGNIHVLKIKNVSLKRQFSIIYQKNKFLTKSAKKFISLCINNNVNP